MSQRDLAEELGLNFNKMHGKIFRAQEARADKIDDKVEGNSRTVKVISGRIKTLTDLINECKIDLDVWEVTRHRVNKWEGYRRAEEKDLQFADGKISGYAIDHGDLHIEPLFQVEAHLLKKNPVALKPVISPVTIEFTPTEIPIPVIGDIEYALIIPDPHMGFSRDLRTNELTPFHDRTALSLILSMMREIPFSKVIFLGDLLDLAEWSDKFARSPEMFFTTQPAIIEAAWYLAQVKSLSTHVTVLAGNHEARLNRLLIKHMNMAYGLKPADNLESWPVMSIPNLLGTKSLGIEYIDGYPDSEVWIGDEVMCSHGDRVNSKSGRTVSAIIDELQHTQLFGHIHRIEMASKTVFNRDGPRYIVACSVGCTCRIDGVVPGRKKKQNWQQGLGIVQYTKTHHEITPVSISNGTAIFDGKIFTGTDYTEQLNKDTEWSF